MADLYNTIANADPAKIRQLAEVLELRAADRQQRMMLDTYLSEIDFPPRAQVVEIGCGTGPVARCLAERSGIAEVVGIDPSPQLLARAKELADGHANLSFRQGAAEALPLDDESTDVAVLHTVLCHLSDPGQALREVVRVLRPGGWLAVFDGDYASTTLARDNLDPLQICAEAFQRYFIHDRWLARHLPVLAKAAGFDILSCRTHSFSETSTPDYLMTIVDRGAMALHEAGMIGLELAEAFSSEARRRSAVGTFFGQIGYASVIARKMHHSTPKSLFNR